MVWENYPTFSYAEVKTSLMDSVDLLSSINEKVVSGGRLNLYNALSGGVPSLSTLTIEAPTDGGKLVIKAVPLKGWKFVEWSGDCKAKPNNLAKTLVKMNKDKHCAAVFEQK